MSRFLKITIEYEMEEYEMNEILTENNMKLSDFENEDEAYKYAAETTFNRGLGCSVELQEVIFMFSIHDWDSIYEYFYKQAMNDVPDEEYAHAYGKSQADLYYCPEQKRKQIEEKTDMTREQRKKQLKGNIQLTVIFTM